MCNDAFEIGWTIAKADHAYSFAKSQIDNWAMINHTQILKNKARLRACANDKSQGKSSPLSHSNLTHRPRLKSPEILDLYNLSELLAESNDQDRFNNGQVTQILKVLRTTITLYKKANQMCDKVLGKYLFLSDINEFKNEKILGKLRDASGLYEEINEMNLVLRQHAASCEKTTNTNMP